MKIKELFNVKKLKKENLKLRKELATLKKKLDSKGELVEEEFVKLIRLTSLDIYDGIDKVTEDIEKMSEGAKNEYIRSTQDIYRSKAFTNEINRLVNTAGKTIIRSTQNDYENSYHRGGIHYLEALKKRMQFLSQGLGKIRPEINEPEERVTQKK